MASFFCLFEQGQRLLPKDLRPMADYQVYGVPSTWLKRTITLQNASWGTFCSKVFLDFLPV